MLDGFSFRPEGSLAKDLPLVNPGEEQTFLVDSVIFWNWRDEFGIHIIGNNGFYWEIKPLKIGTYTVSFTYSNQEQKVSLKNKENKDIELSNFWIGEVSIPAVEICLVES